MKLYTEEQVKNMLSNVLMKGSWVDEFLLNYTPIELPSDEEIEEAFTHKTLMQITIYKGEMAGAKWVIDKIKNQQ